MFGFGGFTVADEVVKTPQFPINSTQFKFGGVIGGIFRQVAHFAGSLQTGNHFSAFFSIVLEIGFQLLVALRGKKNFGWFEIHNVYYNLDVIGLVYKG